MEPVAFYSRTLVPLRHDWPQAYKAEELFCLLNELIPGTTGFNCFFLC